MRVLVEKRIQRDGLAGGGQFGQNRLCGQPVVLAEVIVLAVPVDVEPALRVVKALRLAQRFRQRLCRG
jgi:hypothetical protein